MNQASRKAPSSYSLEMLPLNVTAFIRKRCDLNTSISNTELSKSILKDESPKNEESPTFVSDKNKTYTGFSNTFDSSSSKTGGRSLDGNLEDTTDSNLDSFTAASTLSLNEEAFIGEINKIELKKQGNLSTIKTGTFLKGLDVGTSKLVQSNTDNPLSKKNCRSLDGDLENNTDSNSDSFAAPTLSLDEEAFIGEINKVELKNQSNISTIKTGDVNFGTSNLVQSNSDNHTAKDVKINELELRYERDLNVIKPDSLLKGVDVVFGTAKLLQSSIEAHTVKIVPSNSKTAVNEHKKRTEVHEARKVGVRFSETPKVNFSLPKEKVQQRLNTGSAEIETVLPPYWSPCSVYAARQLKRQIQHIPRSPYNSLTPSESSHISNDSTSDARECFRILCLMILGCIETAILLTIINFVPSDTISGALGIVGLCSLFVIVLLCGTIVVKNGGSRCTGEMACIV